MCPKRQVQLYSSCPCASWPGAPQWGNGMSDQGSLLFSATVCTDSDSQAIEGLFDGLEIPHVMVRIFHAPHHQYAMVMNRPSRLMHTERDPVFPVYFPGLIDRALISDAKFH